MAYIEHIKVDLSKSYSQMLDKVVSGKHSSLFWEKGFYKICRSEKPNLWAQKSRNKISHHLEDEI